MTQRYQISVPIGDGATRRKTVIDENRDLIVDEIRLREFSDIGQDVRPSSPLFVAQPNLQGVDGGARGYIAGGCAAEGPTPSTWGPGHYQAGSNSITSFPFATPTNINVDVGDLINPNFAFGSGAQSPTHGYVAGGRFPITPPNIYNNTIEKFALTTSANATSVGTLAYRKFSHKGNSSSAHGYSTGGSTSPFGSGTNNIERFPFASDDNSVDVGDLFTATRDHIGVSSQTHGYAVSGMDDDNVYFGINNIQKFPFASSVTTQDIGNLSNRVGGSGHQDVVAGASYGFVCGGLGPGPSPNPGLAGGPTSPGMIRRFSFASDGDAVSIGDADFFGDDHRNALTGVSSPNKGYSIGGTRTEFKQDAVYFPFAAFNAPSTITSYAWMPITTMNYPRYIGAAVGTQV
jgi:hypothetical protein